MKNILNFYLSIFRYILERKEEQQQKEMERAKAIATNADCPEGHVPLPDSERKETLRMLKKSKVLTCN